METNVSPMKKTKVLPDSRKGNPSFDTGVPAGSGSPPAGRVRILGPEAVDCYAGYKGNEIPRAVFLEGRRIAIKRVLSRKRVRDAVSGRQREIFSVRLEDGADLILECLEDGRWIMSSKT